jgi:dTDP-4-dehydrorhamnose 3,5-epimerase-like enzyme
MQSKLQIISLPKITDPRGNLTFIEELKHIPFQIARTYWIYDVPGGEIRGSHAFKEQHEILVALSGSFDVVVHDGEKEQKFSLNRSYDGLYLPPMTWRRLENFSTNAICLVMSSHEYSESDYIRDFSAFLHVEKTPHTTPCLVRGDAVVRNIDRKPSVYDAAIVELPRIGERNGHISIVEGMKNLPFDVRRAFCLYDIPAGEDRGAHAHRECHQFLVAASGCFDVMLDDGRNKRTVRLDRPYYGLHIPPGIWAAEQSFSGGTVCLVLASHGYDESDYIRDYNDFLEFIL